MELAPVAEGDQASLVDLVVADAKACRVDDRPARDGLFSAGESRSRCRASNAAVRALVVVVLDETVELALQLLLRGRWLLSRDEALQRLVEPLDFALGLWMAGLAVLGEDPRDNSSASIAPVPPTLEAVKIAPLSVKKLAG